MPARSDVSKRAAAVGQHHPQLRRLGTCLPHFLRKLLQHILPRRLRLRLIRNQRAAQLQEHHRHNSNLRYLTL